MTLLDVDHDEDTVAVFERDRLRSLEGLWVDVNVAGAVGDRTRFSELVTLGVLDAVISTEAVRDPVAEGVPELLPPVGDCRGVAVRVDVASGDSD